MEAILVEIGNCSSQTSSATVLGPQSRQSEWTGLAALGLPTTARVHFSYC